MWFDQNFRFKYLFEETSKKMGKIRQMTATTYCHWWNDNITNIMIWRFYFYFQPLPTWVRRDSKIIADFSVDRERLLNMGYSNVFQCSAGASSKRGENTNSTIMDYLKRVVPRMFQVSSILFYKLFFYLGSVNPILTGEGRLSPPITTGTPNVFHLPAPLRF